MICTLKQLFYYLEREEKKNRIKFEISALLLENSRAFSLTSMQTVLKAVENYYVQLYNLLATLDS